MHDSDDESPRRPPENPPRVLYRGHRLQEVPEHIRRVFGLSEPPKHAKPRPPPPPPPNSYHTKPQFWRMADTGHMAQHNRVGVLLVTASLVFAVLHYKFSRVNNPSFLRWIGHQEITEEFMDEEERKAQLQFELMSGYTGLSGDAWETGKDYRVISKRKEAADKVRWDVKEVDGRITGEYMRDMIDTRDNL